MNISTGLGRQARSRMLVAATLCLGSVQSSTAAPEPKPPPDVEGYVWDLTPLYASDAAWQSDRAIVLRGLETIHELRGTLGQSAATLLVGLNRITDLRQRSANMLECAILTVVDNLRPDDPASRRGFTGVRGRIGSDFSYDLLFSAGVDLATPAPYEAAMKRMRAMVTELEQSVQRHQ
jgi:oligoendopeptidase F